MIKKNGFVFIKSFRSSSVLESVFIERPMYVFGSYAMHRK